MKLFSIFAAILAVTTLGATEPASSTSKDNLVVRESENNPYHSNCMFLFPFPSPRAKGHSTSSLESVLIDSTAIRNPVNLWKRSRCDWCRASLPVCCITKFKSIKKCRQEGCATDWKDCHGCKSYPC
ncbi:hypothetical protein K491DRAFT_684665 [Lophiostoma macrostomum CBS 122681]|uniref:Uncharacterized protein n=1 Tax=Lophiostoma macrostomum CBS 122681 TaxID=1314788 RepID=A0A6A6SQQ9_9PLEO|nr:hypothetical protein K491DRAFT_684665 [Lophiostoma macrostomum CBS 122681]